MGHQIALARCARATSRRLALNRDEINRALTLGYSEITDTIVPKSFKFFWEPPKSHTIRCRRAGCWPRQAFRNGFDAGDYYCDASYSNVAEASLNYLGEIGIRAKLRPFERAAFLKGYAEKKFRNIIQGGSGAFGNAATRMETFVVKGGGYVYGSYPDIDELFDRQIAETDLTKRDAGSASDAAARG